MSLTLLTNVLLGFLAHPTTEEDAAPFHQGLSLMAGTFLFIVIGAVANILVSWKSFPGSDKALWRIIVTYATICLWLPWLCIYMSQMFPIPGVFPVYEPDSDTCNDTIHDFGHLIGG